ncbi:transmembrane [Geomicrobium sp. JCM 19038]|nr:transmembrane [Geomicrobium sp. JCM 19038]
MFLFGALFLLSFAMTTDATIAAEDDREEWVHLHVQAEDVLRDVTEKRYEQARKTLKEMSKPITDADYSAVSLDIHDLSILVTSYERMEQALTSTSLPHEERVREAHRFFYLINAVIHPVEPKWLETRDDVLGQLEDVRKAVERDDSVLFQRLWNEWTLEFHKVQAAMMLRKTPSEQEELRSLLQFMTDHRHRLVEGDEAEPFFKALVFEITRLYNMEEKENDPSLISVIIMVGSAIVASLTYVGVRKYKGQKDRERG